jgi:hypothetical protein
MMPCSAVGCMTTAGRLSVPNGRGDGAQLQGLQLVAV